jgi:hypothetical protein
MDQSSDGGKEEVDEEQKLENYEHICNRLRIKSRNGTVRKLKSAFSEKYRQHELQSLKRERKVEQ